MSRYPLIPQLSGNLVIHLLKVTNNHVGNLILKGYLNQKLLKLSYRRVSFCIASVLLKSGYTLFAGLTTEHLWCHL